MQNIDEVNSHILLTTKVNTPFGLVSRMSKEASSGPSGARKTTHGSDMMDRRKKVSFKRPEEDVDDALLDSISIPKFEHDGTYYVFVKDLAKMWGFPSSYQLIKRMVKQTGLPKSEFLLYTNKELNSKFASRGILAEDAVNHRHFYIGLKYLCRIIVDTSFLRVVSLEEDDLLAGDPLPEHERDILNITQIFPQYRLVDSQLPSTHSAFNCLSSLSKFNFYRSSPGLERFINPSKLTADELELLYRKYDPTVIDVGDLNKEQEEREERKRRKKPLGRTKKHHMNIDPNGMDLTEALIPGQGFIQEFNISHICRTPSYFSPSSHGNGTNQLLNSKKSSSHNSSSLLFGENIKLSKNVQQLVNNDNETFSHTKYFYSKGHKGLGSGNFKDAAHIQKISEIPTCDSKSVRKHHIDDDGLTEVHKKRYKTHVKGFVHEKFDKNLVDSVIRQYELSDDDASNLEVLHNNLQYNFFLNSYREIADDTWTNYYKFKQIDFERLTSESILKKENESIESGHGPAGIQQGVTSNYLLDRFVLPTAFEEIKLNLPVEFREESNESEDNAFNALKKPLYFDISYPDINNADLINKVEIIKLPNPNSVGWDNIKKYRRN